MERTKLQIIAVAALCAALGLVRATCWAEDKAKAGPIEQLAERLSAVFQFRIEAAQLVLNREAWEEKAEPQRKSFRDAMKSMAKSNDARQQANAAQMKAVYEQWLTSPTLGYLVSDICNDLSRNEPPMVMQNGRRPSLFIRNAESFSCWFEMRRVRLSARGNNDVERIELAENDSPRALRFSNDSKDGFRIEFTDGDNNLIVLQQHLDSFAALIIRDDKMLCETSDTFVAFVRKHRELVSEFVLPNLEKVGIRPMLPLESADVRTAALEMLIRPQGDDISSDRKKYEEYRKRITGLLNTTRLLGAPLKKVADTEQTSEVARKTVVGFDLLKDPEYLVSMLDSAKESELSIIAGRLEQLTGEKFGPDAAAWKKWADEEHEHKSRRKLQRSTE
jgi:hypothetical protein